MYLVGSSSMQVVKPSEVGRCKVISSYHRFAANTHCAQLQGSYIPHIYLDRVEFVELIVVQRFAQQY
jgi:hypothetical protein